MRKQGLLLLLVAIMLLTFTVVYAETNTTVKATIEGDLRVKLNGNTLYLTDAQGATVYPLSYNGSTYLPIRALAETQGLVVNWDAKTNTVVLKTLTTGAISVKTTDKLGTNVSKSVVVAKDISVNLDGKVLTLKDAKGNRLYPITNAGTTYLPVRALAETLGLGVNWNPETKSVELTIDRQVITTNIETPTTPSCH